MMTYGIRDVLKLFLLEIHATEQPHSDRQLADHLLGTFDLLKNWNCPFSTCIAGGLHSVYGTNIYDINTLSANERSRVRNRFDIVSERLAWLFGTIDRPAAIEKGFGLNRRTGKMITIKEEELLSLRLIEAANLIEQGDSLKQLPNIECSYLQQLKKRK